MVARRVFLKWVVAVPAGAFAARALVACDDSAGTHADATSADIGDTRLAETLDIGLADTTIVDVSEADSAADAAPDSNADGAPDSTADTTPDTTADSGSDASEVTPRTCAPTGADAQGPYYLAGAPAIIDLAGAEPGTPIALSGLVTDIDCAPIPNAQVEVWQADAAGDYHDDRLRATLVCNAQGAYAFTSILPGRYLQATGFRPAHLHFRVTAAGFRTVVTQIYFAGDPYLQPNDSCATCASDDPARILELTSVAGRETARLDLTLRR